MARKKTIRLVDGSKVESLVEFNGGNSHFFEDNGCYVLVNREEDETDFEPSAWLFPEALEVLRKLPIPKPFFTKAVEDRLAEETTRTVTKKLRR